MVNKNPRELLIAVCSRGRKKTHGKRRLEEKGSKTVGGGDDMQLSKLKFESEGG